MSEDTDPKYIWKGYKRQELDGYKIGDLVNPALLTRNIGPPKPRPESDTLYKKYLREGVI